MTTTRTDIHATITARREAENRPWCEPWNAENAAGRFTRPLHHDGTPYRGINVLVHRKTADAKGYAALHLLNFEQARVFGRCVKAGEKGTQFVHRDRMTRVEGTDDERSLPYTRPHTVSNAEQTTGLPDSWLFQEPLDDGVFFSRRFTAEAGEMILPAGRTVGVGDERGLAAFARQPERMGGAEREHAGQVQVLRAAGEESRIAIVEQLGEAETARVHHRMVDRIAREGAGGGHDGAGAAEAGDSHGRRTRVRADLGASQELHEGEDVVRALGE